MVIVGCYNTNSNQFKLLIFATCEISKKKKKNQLIYRRPRIKNFVITFTGTWKRGLRNLLEIQS